MADNKKVHVLGGGTIYHVRPHLAISAPAYGNTAGRIAELCEEHSKALDVELHLTKMANYDSDIETNADVEKLLDLLISDQATKIIFMNVALCDFEGEVIDDAGVAGKYGTRLRTRARDGNLARYAMLLTPAKKLLKKIRSNRKDIFLVAFKTTCGASKEEQYVAGLNLLKEASCNLVLANDVKTRLNMIITPEEAKYHVTAVRDEALKALVEMAYLRSHLTFTRSTIVSGQPVDWNSPEVPDTLRTVVNHCVARGAYKPFRGATVGHFAVKLNDTTFLTSKRKTNFNDIAMNGLVKVVTDGPDSVIAFGAKPSVGGQSQRIVFAEHPDCDCIIHFHCEKKSGSTVPSVSQREVECGSHQCGKNTSNGMMSFGEAPNNLKAVFLENHGPNIIFNRSIDPRVVIQFIEDNFDLSSKTGGWVGTIPEHEQNL